MASGLGAHSACASRLRKAQASTAAAGGEDQDCVCETGVLVITCGVLKEELKGTIGCLLLNGLENITRLTFICAQHATTHDKETGNASSYANGLKKEPLEAKFGEMRRLVDEHLAVRYSEQRRLHDD